VHKLTSVHCLKGDLCVYAAHQLESLAELSREHLRHTPCPGHTHTHTHRHTQTPHTHMLSLPESGEGTSAWRFDRWLCISGACVLNQHVPQCCVHRLVRGPDLVRALIKLGTRHARSSGSAGAPPRRYSRLPDWSRSLQRCRTVVEKSGNLNNSLKHFGDDQFEIWRVFFLVGFVLHPIGGMCGGGEMELEKEADTRLVSTLLHPRQRVVQSLSRFTRVVTWQTANGIYIALFKVLKDTLHVAFIHHRHSYRELVRVKCLAQGHIVHPLIEDGDANH